MRNDRRAGSQRLALALLALLALCRPAAAQVPEPSAYRQDHYRAPVPATIAGGTLIDPKALAALIPAEHPVLIDVLPAPTRPPGLPAGHPWLPVPHQDIPGSLWLPDVGRGAISPALETWFHARLATATANHQGKPVVFYCLSQCWMSWNAAKRAISYGYTRVFWLEAGADGWTAAGYPLAVARPEVPSPR
jgi:PQQ-dependent catabolism-associated CXXCW motif protein